MLVKGAPGVVWLVDPNIDWGTPHTHWIMGNFVGVTWPVGTSTIFQRPLTVSTHSLNTLRLRYNGHHWSDGIFECIFINEKFCILIKISLKFVRKGPIDNNPALVQIMARHWIGNKPLSEPMISVAYRYRKSISIIDLFVSIISIYIGFLATNF